MAHSFISKLFLITCVCGLVVYIFLALYLFQVSFIKYAKHSDDKMESVVKTQNNHTRDKMKYILIWTINKYQNYLQISEGQTAFINQNCLFKNCHITRNKNIFKNITEFDAILFEIKNLKLNPKAIPKYRCNHQKYIFVSQEPADKFPICNSKFDNFFNWTWTYKLDSDIVSPFIEISFTNGSVIGPKSKMKWKTDMPITDELKIKLKSKSKPVVLLLDRCYKNVEINKYIEEFNISLELFDMKLDTYGPCSSLKCPKNDINECLKLVERDYLFYVVYEDGITKDYITKALLTALNNYAVPVILGNHSSYNFLPPGSYLQSHSDVPLDIVYNIKYALKNIEVYHKYFEWRNFYRYQEANFLDSVCQLCSRLNGDQKFGSPTTYNNFRKWWYPELKTKCMPLERNNARKFKFDHIVGNKEQECKNFCM